MCRVDLGSDGKYFLEHVAKLRDSLTLAVNNKNKGLLQNFYVEGVHMNHSRLI
jgi:hypothetical protein